MQKIVTDTLENVIQDYCTLEMLFDVVGILLKKSEEISF